MAPPNVVMLLQSQRSILRPLPGEVSAACRGRQDAFLLRQWMLLNLSCRSCRDLFVSGSCPLWPGGSPETNQCHSAFLTFPNQASSRPLSLSVPCSLLPGDWVRPRSCWSPGRFVQLRY